MATMTSKERNAAVLAGNPVDRIAHFPFILGFSARNVGYPIQAIYSDAEKSYAAQQRTFEQYGVDWGPLYGYASYGTWEFGGQIEMPTGTYQQAPSHKTFPVNDEAEAERLARPDVRTAGCLPIAMEFSRLQEQNGTPISVIMGGNFTLAGNLCSVAKLCRWMIKKPDLAHHLLRLATDHILETVAYWVNTFGAEKVIPQFWEPMASNLIISPRQFKNFVLPYLAETGERIAKMGVRHVLHHICGDQNANMPMWAEVAMGDPGLCSFGDEIDIDKAIEVIGHKAVLIGNLDPSLLLTGQPGEIVQRCRQIIEKGKRAPRGFMFSVGCELAPETPGYHLYLVQKALETFGRMDND